MENTAAQFLDFVNAAVTPFHACAVARQVLLAAGFKCLTEHEPWQLTPGHTYVCVRNESVLFAFAVGPEFQWARSAFRVVSTHTDSACPKLALAARSVDRLNVQFFGPGRWHSWCDRDLTVAGRVVFEGDGQLRSCLVHVPAPILSLSQLDSQAKPSLVTTGQDSAELLNTLGGLAGCPPEAIQELELNLVDTAPAKVTGLRQEFVSASRLNNLTSAFCTLQALAQTRVMGKDILLWVAGEGVAGGTECAGVRRVMKRILRCLPLRPSKDALACVVRRSLILSAAMTHTSQAGPSMWRGVIIKTGLPQHCSTDSVGASYIRALANRLGVPVQQCEVTEKWSCCFGPRLAAHTGCRTVELGAPQLAMHSCREMMAVEDLQHYYRLFHGFYSDEAPVYAEALLK